MIDKIGIELEGGWEEIPTGAKIIADLSIDGRTLTTDRVLRTNHVGEIVSPPLLLTEWEEWLTTFYPDDVNRTCGLHVHVSLLSKAQYSLLMSLSFERRVIASAAKLAEKLTLPKRGNRTGVVRHYIWDRIEGKNPFCLFGVLPHEQTYITEKRIGMKARYASLNYCWSMHGTVEYRLLPMFPEGSSVAALFIQQFLTDITEELKKKSEKRFYLQTALRERNGIIEERERG